MAHENTRKHLSKATRVEGNWQYTFPVEPAGAIPSIVFKDEYTLHINNSTLMLKHYLPAHADSDISVHFPEADILYTGDTFGIAIIPLSTTNRRQYRRPRTPGRNEHRKSD